LYSVNINYPKNIKLRIYYKNTTQNQIDKLLIELQLKYNVIIDDIIEDARDPMDALIQTMDQLKENNT